MLVLDAFTSILGDGASAAEAELALAGEGLAPTDVYASAMREAVERACIDPLHRRLSRASETEPGLSIAHDRAMMRGRLLWLARRHGRRDILEQYGPPRIRDVSRMR